LRSLKERILLYTFQNRESDFLQPTSVWSKSMMSIINSLVWKSIRSADSRWSCPVQKCSKYELQNEIPSTNNLSIISLWI
jgi:hypothetical protein